MPPEILKLTVALILCGSFIGLLAGEIWADVKEARAGHLSKAIIVALIATGGLVGSVFSYAWCHC